MWNKIKRMGALGHPSPLGITQQIQHRQHHLVKLPEDLPVAYFHTTPLQTPE
tara:strand:- start:47 stop:202 length:156 start_codon:yes stop_codon:yes gene_type:complete